MSLVEKWIKRVEKQTHCAGERSQHTGDRAPGERAPCTCEHTLGERSPRPANVRTRASLNPAGTLDNLKCNSKSPS
jgi:hypothetical protein